MDCEAPTQQKRPRVLDGPSSARGSAAASLALGSKAPKLLGMAPVSKSHLPIPGATFKWPAPARADEQPPARADEQPAPPPAAKGPAADGLAAGGRAATGPVVEGPAAKGRPEQLLQPAPKPKPHLRMPLGLVQWAPWGTDDIHGLAGGSLTSTMDSVPFDWEAATEI